jgi:hypothetical protein
MRILVEDVKTKNLDVEYRAERWAKQVKEDDEAGPSPSPNDGNT